VYFRADSPELWPRESAERQIRYRQATGLKLGAGERVRTAGSRLQEACSLAVHAVAAPMSRVIALMALDALGFSCAPGHDPFHDPFHVGNLATALCCYRA
jgi:hypothetical protein